MKKNIFKKLISLGLALTLTCSVGLTVMNNVPKTAIASAKLSEIEFWQTYATDKILQDMPDIYDDIKQPAIIDLTAIRGEEEAAQIIMTSGDKAVSSYDVTVSDLKFGNEVYSKENITVYHQKYIYVVGAEYYKLTGWFPDCLVPFENVKGVGENNFAKNNNQGLYISFEVPEDQLPGQYTGTIGVTIGGETKSIPITLDVSDAVIGVETNFLSCFQNKWHMDRGELDTSNEMLDAYNRKLFEYRLGCSNLLFRNQHTDREIEEYAKYAATYSAMPEFAGYDIPLDDKSYKNEEVYGRVINGTSRNPVVLKKYFMAIAYAGLEAGVDTFAKAFIYGRDEPDLNGTADSIVQNDGFIIRHTKEDAIATLKADRSIPADKQELLNQMCESLDGIPHVVTSSTFMSSVKFDLEEEDMVYCPEFQYIETDSLRDQYRMSPDNDLWWYGCCNPDYPYPTYHTDDTVISARLLSWMQADYNIQGNLYWAADYYAGLNGANAPNNYAEDYYTGNNAARSVRTNGEGYLFYPGSKYDVYGPLPSVRLEQIRDGMEEADMIMALKEIYNGVSQQTGINFTEDTFMNYVYAVDGEWDSFDDQGSIYTTLVESSAIKKVGWEENYQGREGVLKVEIAKNDAYATSFMAVPKFSDIETVADYDKLVVNMYVDGEEGAIQQLNFCHPNIGSLKFTNVKYGGWMTYVFNKTAIVNNWQHFARGNDYKTTNNHFVGTYLKDCTVYIDNIYFANGIDVLEGAGATEKDGVVTMDYEIAGEQLQYVVTYDGKWVETDGNTFKAEYAGDYKITPIVVNSNKTVYTGAPMTYTSVSENKLELNAYDKVIALNATEYTLPQAKVVDGSGAQVDGYEMNVKTIFRDYANQVVERNFTTGGKGWYEYIITASKSGEKTLYYNAIVRIGDYLPGEVFNVNDNDAATRVGSMFMGASYSVVDGQEIAEEHKDEKYLKIATNLSNQYLTKTGYFNFSPSATLEDVNSTLYDLIKVKFYLKASVKEGATAQPMTITFFGTKTELKLNDWTEITVNASAFENNYTRMCIPATWGDYVVTFGNMNYSNFSSFAIYMSSITADIIETPEDFIIVNESNYTQFNNADVPMTYVSKSELANAGLTGDYNGNAVMWTHSANNSGYRINNTFSKRQLNELKTLYSSVEINFAVGAPADQTAYVLLCTLSGSNPPVQSLISLANGGTNLNISGAKYNVWNKMYIPIDAFVEFAYGQSNLSLFRTYCDTKFNRDFYFGDIKFLTPAEEPAIAKEIVTVTDKNAYIHNDYSENYVTAEEMQTLGFTGGYNGNAVKWPASKNNSGYYKMTKPNYTEAQITNIKAHYKSVVINVALTANASTSNSWYYWLQDGLLSKATEDGIHNASKVYKFSAGNDKVWRQFEVPVEEYLAYVDQSVETVNLFKYYYGEKYGSMSIYLGDMYFVAK